jgi:hypothetical protein
MSALRLALVIVVHGAALLQHALVPLFDEVLALRRDRLRTSERQVNAR